MLALAKGKNVNVTTYGISPILHITKILIQNKNKKSNHSDDDSNCISLSNFTIMQKIKCF